LEGLWRRGGADDVESIRALVEAHPALPPPPFLQGPEGTRLDIALGEKDLPEVVAFLENEYWHKGTPRDVIARSHVGAQAWIGLRSQDGRLLGSARAMSDGARLAHIADVIVHPEYRGRGYGRVLMRCLLEHPSLRNVSVVRLGTADQQRFYESLGFVDAKTIDPGFPTTHMLRLRSAS
jgi:ribosomal protein S18 acetylase RimI-like enzyme